MNHVYSPDGSRIAVADSGNNRVQVFNATDRTFVFEFGENGGDRGQFKSPNSVAYSPNGSRIAVADKNNDRIQVFSAADGAFAFEFGASGNAAGQFSRPQAVAYSADGAWIAVADSGNNRVQVFSAADGAFAGAIGLPGDGKFDNPRGVAFVPLPPGMDGRLAQGAIVVSERAGNRVQVFHPNGAFDFSFGQFGNATGQFNQPMSAAVAPGGGAIAVADTGNNRVQVFGAGGAHSRTIGSPGVADGQLDAPASAAWSPDGTRIVVADAGNDRVQVFDAANGTVSFKLGSHGSGAGYLDAPASAAWSPDGTRIIVADTGNDRVQVFSVATGAPVLAFGARGAGDGNFSSPASAAYSPDGTRIIVADTGNDRVQIFYPNGTFVSKFGSQGVADGQFIRPTSVAYSADGGRIAVADRDSDRIQVFNAADNTLAFKVGSRGTGDGYFMRPASVSFSGQLPPPMMPGMLAVADSPTNRVKVFYPDGTFAFEFGRNVESGDGHLKRPQDVAYSPDGTKIVTASPDTTRIHVFNAVDGTIDFAFGSNGTAPGQFLHPGPVGWSPDGTRIAAADGANNRTQIFHAENGTLDTVLVGVRGNIAYSLPDGDQIARPDRGGGSIQVYHAANGTLDFEFGTQGNGTGQLNKPRSVAYSPDGTRIAVSDTGNNRVQVFDAATRTAVLVFGGPGSGDGQFNTPRGIAYSTDGTRIAVADIRNDRIQIFSAADGRFIGKIDAAGSGVYIDHPKAVSFAPPSDFMPAMPDPEPEPVVPPGGNGAVAPPAPDMLAVGGNNLPIQVLYADNTTLAFEIGRGHIGSSFDLEYLPDGSRLVVGSGDHVFIFHSNGTLDSKFLVGSRATGVAYSPDGDRIAVTYDYGGKLHKLSVFHSNGTLDFEAAPWGHITLGQVYDASSVAYSPDGTRIAVADEAFNRILIFHSNGTFDHRIDLVDRVYNPQSVDYSLSDDRIITAGWSDVQTNHLNGTFDGRLGVRDISTIPSVNPAPPPEHIDWIRHLIVNQLDDYYILAIDRSNPYNYDAVYSPSGDKIAVASTSSLLMFHSNGTLDSEFRGISSHSGEDYGSIQCWHNSTHTTSCQWTGNFTYGSKLAYVPQP